MTIIQQNSGTVSGVAEFTATLPVATNPANRVVVLVAGDTTCATPAGWTLRDSAVNALGHFLFDRPGDSGTSWVFTLGVAGRMAWIALEVEAGVFGTSGSAQTLSTVSSTTTPAITPTAGTRLLIASIGAATGSPGTPSRTASGWLNSFIELFDLQVTGGNDNPSHAVAARHVTADGTTAYSSGAAFSGAVTSHSRIIAAYSTTPVPEPPTLTPGTARPVVRGGSVTLDVTATPPSGQTIASHSWAIQSGGGSLTGATTATPTYLAPSTGNGLVVIRDTVTASGGGIAVADVTVSYHANIVAAENALPGTPRATWDLADPNFGGLSTLQGFCDGFSANRTQVVNFKIAQSDAAGWSADIYRLGYYAGNGARFYGTLTPSSAQLAASQAQPAPDDADPSTTLLSADCAGWSVTLTWTPPVWVPSGIYVLRLNRTGGSASHVMFIVRDDQRLADLMLMPSDSTWNAYNAFGGMGAALMTGNSLYFGTTVNQYHADCARTVSYNRPVVNRAAHNAGQGYGAVGWSNFFTAEYPMVRFIERNGYDTKYYGCIDAAADPLGQKLIGKVRTGMFVGHNEYWSDTMRSGWEAAKAAGVSIFSCAGNEVFWRTVGSALDTDGRPRTWECQKSTIDGRGNTQPQWTGTWRDPDGAGKGGNNPENSLTGTIFVVNGPTLLALAVPFAGNYSKQPLWRHTEVAEITSGQWQSPGQILGFEWDTYGPAGTNGAGGQFMAAPHPQSRYCSDAEYPINGLLLIDAGDVYGTGTATHRLVVTPAGIGGLVFGTGTINWSLGCDEANTYQIGLDNTSTPIRQATVNMLTDMGVAPVTLIAGLTMPAKASWFYAWPPRAGAVEIEHVATGTVSIT